MTNEEKLAIENVIKDLLHKNEFNEVDFWLQVEKEISRVNSIECSKLIKYKDGYYYRGFFIYESLRYSNTWVVNVPAYGYELMFSTKNKCLSFIDGLLD